MTNTKSRFQFRWYHGLIFFIIVNLIGGYGITRFVDIKTVFTGLNRPWFAPPAWVFGPVWATNNILTITGNIWTLNLPASLDRTRLLWLQALSWVNFCIFQYLSFGTQIPSMFFWPTFSMFILTFASLYFAYRLDTKEMSFWSKIKSGRSVTLSLVSLASWLTIATVLGFQIWMLNK